MWSCLLYTSVEEGMILRNNGIQKPILILGYIFPDQYEEVIQAEICPSVFTLEMAKELSAAAEKVGKDCRMHFAVDTGMSRIGYQVTEEAADEMAQIAKLPHMIVEGIFTHFAKADEYDKTFTKEQIQKFRKIDVYKRQTITCASLKLLDGSGPPSFTATAISLPIIVKILPFAASFFSFLCLILANFECPDITLSSLFLVFSSVKLFICFVCFSHNYKISQKYYSSTVSSF